MKYRIESFYLGEWRVIVKDVSRSFCDGVMWATQYEAPRLAYRVVREDGKIDQERPAIDEVHIGQVAGYPTANQYERAAAAALARAAFIRGREARDEARRASP